MSIKILLVFAFWLIVPHGHECSQFAEVKSNCTGLNVCLRYDASISRKGNSSVYWFDKTSGKCILLGIRCIVPNFNSTFESKESCDSACKGEVINDHKVTKCGDGKKECDQDIPPTSNTTSRALSPVIAIVCAIGGIALVAIIVVGTYMAQRRKKIQKRRLVKDMLHMWSSNSDDSYDSYEDNPEDNNLFDRLERNW